MSDAYIANLKARLKHNEEEHELLVAALNNVEALARFDGAEQLSMNIDAPVSNGVIGKMSFNKGIFAALQYADGEPLCASEIWKRMQQLGVKSNAKRPESFIIWHARKNPDKIEDLGDKIFRWIGN